MLKSLPTEIPLAVNAMSRYFQQPDSSEILIDDEAALMTQSTFDKLLNYEHTYPTASYLGKVWRAGTTLVFIGHDPSGLSPSGLLYFRREILIFK
jgi:hypothetical protein